MKKPDMPKNFICTNAGKNMDDVIPAKVRALLPDKNVKRFPYQPVCKLFSYPVQ